MIPAYIRYTDDMPQGFGGVTTWCFIKIRPKYRDDAGLHAHELEHAKQWWIVTLLAVLAIAAICYVKQAPYWFCLAGVVVFDLLVTTFQRVRLQLEVWAYRKQIPHYPDDRTAYFAQMIATKYGLEGVTAERAEKLLRA
jgi:hypothetical protein